MCKRCHGLWVHSVGGGASASWEEETKNSTWTLPCPRDLGCSYWKVRVLSCTPSHCKDNWIACCLLDNAQASCGRIRSDRRSGVYFWQAMVWEWWDILLPSSLVDITWRNCRRTKTLACSPRAFPFQYGGWEWGGGPSSSFPTTPSTKSHALLLWIVCFYCAFHWEFVLDLGGVLALFLFFSFAQIHWTFLPSAEPKIAFFFFFFTDGYNTPTLLCYVSRGVQ